MIVRPRSHWLRMLFTLRGSVLMDIASQLLIAIGFAVIVTVLHGRLFLWKVTLTFVPFSLIGLTLAIFLGFRNNTSYARYWEARVLWGTLLNDSRALARQALTLVDSIGVMTPVIVGFIAYTFFAPEALSSQIEEPFGTEPNDVALDALAMGIEASLRETLGETDLPPPSQPVNYVLT